MCGVVWRFTVNVLCVVLGNKFMDPFVFDNLMEMRMKSSCRMSYQVCWKTSR